jgi:hypothetical protein
MALQDWLEANSPRDRYSALSGAQPRKLFRLGVAFLTRVRDRLPTRSDLDALETTERYVDGRASMRELVEAWTEAELAGGEGIWVSGGPSNACVDYDPDERPDFPGTLSMARVPWLFAAHAASAATRLLAGGWYVALGTPEHEKHQEERVAQYHVYRDLIGDQYARPQPSPVALDRSPEVRKLLAAISRQQTPEAMDLLALADAAEEAGCVDGGLLAHLRDGRTHYRGCSAVERLAGREMIRLSQDDGAFVTKKRIPGGW